MVQTGLFISGGAANHTSYASRYVAALALAATPPFNLSSSPYHVNSIVLQSIAADDQPAALYNTAISHAISGAKAASIPLFVGTIIPHSSQDKYCSQVVLNATYVAAVVKASAAAARAFVQRYGPVHDGWYVTHETFLNFFGEGCHASAFGRHLSAVEVAAGYAQMLQSWTKALDDVTPGLPILWSPAAPESPRRSRPAAAKYAAALATSLRTVAAAAPLITNLTIQDSVGKASNVSNGTVRYAVGCDDALFHANVAREAMPRTNIAINMEIFLRAGQRVPPSSIVDLPADPRETEQRAVCYVSHGFAIGPSWEMGYWYRQLTEEWALPSPHALDAPVHAHRRLVK